MNPSSKIIQILNFEEGYKEKPYIDTEGFPTVACGLKIGPKNAALSNYQFTVPRKVGDVWLQEFVDRTVAECRANSRIAEALGFCNTERADIIYSMAYQLGTKGLAGFANTLAAVARGDFKTGAAGMLDSLWARQTPNRAKRHAEVMRSGTLDAYKGLL